MISLRPYQQKAVESVLSEWDEGRRRTLLVLPTGAGKTVCFASVLKSSLGEGEKALVLAHRGELLFQAADKINDICGVSCALEKGESSAHDSSSSVVLGSVQTLSNASRLASYPRDYFSKIVVDEAHHTMSGSYLKILEHFNKAEVLGCTATPSRADRKSLSGFYDSIAYEYSLAMAIRDGYLCPIKAEMIPLKLDLSNARVCSGDYSADDIGMIIEPYLPLIAEEMKEKCKGRKTVVFLPLVKTSLKFLEVLKSLGMNAEEVNGQSPDREEKLKRFEKGETDILLNSMLLTEGWDCPSVDCIVVLRPTKIRGLYMQMVGRGTRLHQGKKDLLLLDFLWLAERMDICRPSSLVSSNEKVSRLIDEKVENDEEPVDLMEAEEEAQRDAVREREQTLALQLKAMRKKERKLVDPLQFAISLDNEVLMDYEPTFAWEMEPASDKQMEFLESRGIATDTIQNKGYASMLISRIQNRKALELSTPRQIRLLEKYGFEKVGLWRFEEANRVIAALEKRKWRLPYNFVAKAYRPKSLGGKI